jgi:hypothetical protein
MEADQAVKVKLVLVLEMKHQSVGHSAVLAATKIQNSSHQIKVIVTQCVVY